MKKSILFTLLFISTLFVGNSFGQSKLIHYWHFNTGTFTMYTDTIHGISADYSDLDVTKAKILYAKKTGTSAAYMTYIDTINVAAADADTVNARMGQIDGNALRARNPSDSMNLLFYIPTTHFKNIKLTYASQSSSITKGQLHQIFSYSTDSGSTWKTSGLSMPSDSAWLVYHRTTVTFTTDTTVNNNPKLVFKITFAGNDTGVKGNNRFDNITVDGDTITSSKVAVENVASIEPAYTLYPNPVGNTLAVRSETEGVKSFVIVDITGRSVFTGTTSGKEFTVAVASLQAGTYFISIRDENTGLLTSKKFVKQ